MSQNDDAPIQQPVQQADEQPVQQTDAVETDELSDDQLDTISGGVGSEYEGEEEEVQT